MEPAKKVKEIRLSQLPEEVQNAIRKLDKQFGSAIKVYDELLPKLADKNGKINTSFLFNTFKNPAQSGMRTYLNNLKSVDINLNSEINIIKGWVRRQAIKKTAVKVGATAVGLGALGEGINATIHR